jgi:hypothetical protein
VVSPTERPAHIPRWSAADLRPQRALTGLPSYHRCALSPDERLVAYGVQPLTYGTPGNSRLGALVLPTGAPSRLLGAELYVDALSEQTPDSGRVLERWGWSRAAGRMRATKSCPLCGGPKGGASGTDH